MKIKKHLGFFIALFLMLITISAYADTLVIAGTDRGDKTLTAKWKANTYTITYNTDGGTLPSTAPKNFNVESAAFVIPQPTKTGYVFTGWTGSNGTTPIISVTVQKGTCANLSYTAHWAPNKLYVKYNVNGGSLASAHSESISGVDGDGFLKYSAAMGVNTVSPDSASAIFTGNYGENIQNITAGSHVLFKPQDANYINLARTGYYIDAANAWNTQADGNGKSYAGNGMTAYKTSDFADLSTGNKEVSLYAQWKPINYIIRFNANTGTGTMADQNVSYGNVVSLTSNTFRKSDHRFTGWAESAAGSVKYLDGAKVQNLSSTAGAVINLYAIWRSEKALFDSGSSVNAKLKALAGTNTVATIARSSGLPSGFKADAAHTVSASDSGYEIYAWYDSTAKALYWYCEAPVAYLNTDASGMFQGFTAAAAINLSGIDFSKAVNVSNMFRGDEHVTELDFSNAVTSSVKNATDMMSGVYRMSTVSVGAGFTLQAYIPTPNAAYIDKADGKWTNAAGIAYAPANIPKGVSDTYYALSSNAPAVLAPKNTWYKGSTAPSEITNIVFTNTYTETGIEKESWNADVANTGSIKAYVSGSILYVVNNKYKDGAAQIAVSQDMSGMFSVFTNVTNITGLNVLNTVNMKKADNFFGTSATSGAVKLTKMSGYENWNVTNLSSVSNMFSAIKMEEIDLSKWTILSLTSMDSMFQGTNIMHVNLRGMDVTKVKTAKNMFANATTQEINLYGWKNSSMTDTTSMFQDAAKLKTVYAGDTIDFTKASASSNMFSGASGIVGGYGTVYDSTKIDKTYARLDNTGTKGYLTKYVVGAGEINGKLYTTGVESNSYNSLSVNGSDATSWDYRNGSRLLEINLSNLAVGKENKLEITVPVGMYIDDNSWTTPAKDSRIKSVTFTKNASQNTGSYTNNMTGTLTYTIDAASTAAQIKLFMNYDQNLWDKFGNNGSLVKDSMVKAALDGTNIIKLNNVQASVSYNSGNGVYSTRQGNIPNIYVSDKRNQSTDSTYALSTGMGGTTYYKSITVSISAYSTDANGSTIYANLATYSLSNFGAITKQTVNGSDGKSTFQFDNTVVRYDCGIYWPAFQFYSTKGFTVGKLVTINCDISATSYVGKTHNWNIRHSYTLKSEELNYNDISVRVQNKSIGSDAWHADNKADKYLDPLFGLSIENSGYATAPNVNVEYNFDTGTTSGAPALRVQAGRIVLPSGQKTDASVTVIDSSGTKYGPYKVANLTGNNNSGAYINAKTVANSNGLTGSMYYLKKISYKIASLPSGKQGGYWEFYTPGSAGGFIGRASGTATSTLKVTFPDGTSKTGTATTTVTDKPSHNYTMGLATSDLAVVAGKSITLDYYVDSSTPYGSSQYVKTPVLYLVLPYGINVKNAIFSSSQGGAAIGKAKISTVKQIIKDGVIYNDYAIEISNASYGYYNVSGGGDGRRWFRVTLDTDADMAATKVVLRTHSFFTDKGLNDEFWNWTYKIADSDNVDNDSSTNRLTTLYNNDQVLTVNEAAKK